MATTDQEQHGPPATAGMQWPDPDPSGAIGLIAEDEDVADSLLMLLTSHAYVAERLPMTPGSVGDWDGRSFSCLVVAQYSPSLPGLVLLSALRTRGNDRPAALITNAMSPQDYAYMVRLGGITLLEKPVKPSVVLAYVGQHGVRTTVPQPDSVPPTAPPNNA